MTSKGDILRAFPKPGAHRRQPSLPCAREEQQQEPSVVSMAGPTELRLTEPGSQKLDLGGQWTESRPHSCPRAQRELLSLVTTWVGGSVSSGLAPGGAGAMGWTHPRQPTGTSLPAHEPLGTSQSPGQPQRTPSDASRAGASHYRPSLRPAPEGSPQEGQGVP